MIVEDEPLLALQLEDELIDAGHDVVGCAMTASEATTLAGDEQPDLVLLDVYLQGGSTGIEIAPWLAQDAVVVFLTAAADELPGDLAGAVGVIEKPYSSRAMRAALAWLAQAIDRGVPPPPPYSLRLAPHFQPRADGLYGRT
jgi:DNA-binding response OmpR family regulator